MERSNAEILPFILYGWYFLAVHAIVLLSSVRDIIHLRQNGGSWKRLDVMYSQDGHLTSVSNKRVILAFICKVASITIYWALCVVWWFELDINSTLWTLATILQPLLIVISIDIKGRKYCWLDADGRPYFMPI